TVRRVLAETDIGHKEELRHFLLNGTESTLDDSVLVVGAAAHFILFFGDTEKDHGWNSERLHGYTFTDDFIHGHLEYSRHGGNLPLHLLPGADKKRVDEIILRKLSLAHH